jgi:hypothetical protein
LAFRRNRELARLLEDFSMPGIEVNNQDAITAVAVPLSATALRRAAAALAAARKHPADLPRPTGSANAFRAGDDRLAVLFSESLDFERRGRPTADLLEEKI